MRITPMWFEVPYCGPFLRCTLPSAILVTKIFCTNTKCQYNKVPLKDKSFCDECGSTTIARDVQGSPGTELAERLIKVQKKLHFTSCGDFDAFMPERVYNLKGAPRQFWMDADTFVLDSQINMGVEKEWFARTYAILIMQAKLHYSDHRVRVDWAIFCSNPANSR